MIYILFDLEATCWEREACNGRIGEIIEIGAVKLGENTEQLDTFQTFIKPTKNPILSEFCVGLTTIKQSDVDSAPYFAEAMLSFEDWICGENGDFSDIMLISWGYYDKNAILQECNLKHYYGNIISMLKNHRSLKHDFAKFRSKRCGMEKALEILGIPLEGTHHRGIDDALNIAKIFKAVFEEWQEFLLKDDSTYEEEKQ